MSAAKTRATKKGKRSVPQMNAGIIKWPFRPDHITNDGPALYEKTFPKGNNYTACKNSHDRNRNGSAITATALEYERIKQLKRLDGQGIISNKYLQGLQTMICANLENPTTVIEFPPDGKSTPVRTDSRLLIFNLHGACRIFRKYTESFCLNCDNAYANLYRGLNSQNIKYEVPKRCNSNTMPCNSTSTNSGQLYFHFDTSSPRPYMEYDCHMMGYRELLYPIFFEKRIVAGFFVGELCLEDRLNVIKNIQHNFLFTNAEWRKWLEDYCADSQEIIDPDTICNEILAAHNDWVKDTRNIFFSDEDYKEYREFKKRVSEELDELERTLDQQASLQRERYVRTCIDRRILTFQERLPKKEETSERKWKRLWTNITKRFADLIGDFSIEYVVLFAKNQYQKDKSSLLEATTWAGRLPKRLKKSIDSKDLYLDIEKVPKQARNQRVTSREYPDLLKSLQRCPLKLNKRQHLLRLFPVPFYPRAHVAALVGYKNDNLADSPDNKEEGHLDPALQSFYSNLLHAYSALLADEAEEKMKDALRVFGHEAAQVTSGLAWLWKLYLEDPSKIRNLSKDKLSDISGDLISSQRFLSSLFANARFLLDLPKVKKEKFWPYGEFIYKWKDFSRMQMDRKNCQIDITYPLSSPWASAARPPMYADPELIESIFFNLLNNAVKYCYQGTKIKIDCRLKTPSQPNISPHMITITDYGIENTAGDRAFDLHVRGHNVVEEKGLGIGLTIAQNIAKAHGGIIEQNCRKISDYNVPLIPAYLELTQKNEELAKELKEEIDNIAHYTQLQLKDILALGQNEEYKYKPEDTELTEEQIRITTYEVAFAVYIHQ